MTPTALANHYKDEAEFVRAVNKALAGIIATLRESLVSEGNDVLVGSIDHMMLMLPDQLPPP